MTRLGAAPSVATHVAKAPRIAFMHTWLGTQTEGWWRLAFDKLGVPYDYISTQEGLNGGRTCAPSMMWIVFCAGGPLLVEPDYPGLADVGQRFSHGKRRN